MTLTNPTKPEFMVQASQEIFVAKRWSDTLKNIGVYKNPDRSSAAENSDDVYANWKTKKIKGGDQITVKFDIHENDPELLAIIDNGVIETYNEVASVVDRTESFKPGNWSFDQDIILKSRNEDNSEISVVINAIIDGVSTLLVEGTDYSTGVTTFGDTYVKLIEKVTTGNLLADAPSSVTINIKYSATPDATLKKVTHYESAMPTGFVMVLEEKWQHKGNEVGIRIFLEKCQNVKAITKPISDADNTSAGYPCEITGTIKNHEFFGFAE